MNKVIIICIAILVMTSCAVKEKKDGFLKTGEKNIYKTDYGFYNYYVPTSEVKFSFLGLINSFYPYHANKNSELFLRSSVYSTLFTIDPENGFPVKNLVKDFEITDSDLKYKFTIYDNIRFSDGRYLDSDDVVASLSIINTVLKDTVYASEFTLDGISVRFEKTSNYEFDILLDKPNGNLLYGLCRIPILKKDVLDLTSDDISAFISKWTRNSLPPGTGPYFIKDFSENMITLHKNHFYFKNDIKGVRLPYSDVMTILLYTEKKKMVEDFIGLKSDVMQLDENISYETGSNDFNILSDYYKNNNKEKIKIIDAGLSSNRTFFVYNYDNENETAGKHILKDQKTRQYISAIIGSAIRENEDISFVSKPESKSGYELEKNKINDAAIDLIIPEDDGSLKDIGNKVFDKFNEEKIKIRLHLLPFNKYLENLFITKEFDIALVKYKFSPGLMKLFQFINGDKYSFSHYIDDDDNTLDKIHAMMKEALHSSNFAEQKKITGEIFTILNKKKQYIPMITRHKYYIIQNNVRNFKVNSTYESYNLNTIEYIEKKLTNK